MSSLQLFVRWLHGSCIECPPQQTGDDEPVIFSFFSDISQNPTIIEQAILITQNMHKLLASLTKYLNRWKRYRPLWKLDKAIVMEKFAAKKPPCVVFDEKLQFYMKVAQEVMQQPMVKDEQCIRLLLAPLAFTVQENARSWVNSLGKLLNESAKEMLYSLQENIEVGFSSWGCSPWLYHAWRGQRSLSSRSRQVQAPSVVTLRPGDFNFQNSPASAGWLGNSGS